MYVMCQCSLLNFGTVQTVIFYRSSVREITYYSLPSSELLRFLVQNSVQKQSVLYHPGFKGEMKVSSQGEGAGTASMNFSLAMVGLSLALE